MKIEAPMQRTDVNAVLAQMRALREAAQARSPAADLAADAAASAAAAPNATAPASALATFGAHLQSALQSVNTQQLESGRLADGFARGEHQDLVATMVSSQKANVAFQAATQVRNRLVTAYETIMNMPI